MTDKSKASHGYDTETHHLLLIKEVPPSFLALRKELIEHPDIFQAAQEGRTFEECIGIIGAKLDIAMDGLYDVEPLCEMLVDVLRKRNSFSSLPHLRHSSLVDVELLEKEGTVEIVERDRNVATVAPDGAVVTNVSTSIPDNSQTASEDSSAGNSTLTSGTKNNPPD